MRLIDADALKKRAYPFPCAIGTENAVPIRVINDAPTVPTWISVKGRLPEPGERVLMLIDDATVFEGWYQIDGWRRYEKSDVPVEKWLGKVTRWMPLPTRPDTEEKS